MIMHTSQEDYKYYEGALAEYLHSVSICPGNHWLGYQDGVFAVDEKEFEAPLLEKRAEQAIESNNTVVRYSPGWNCYVLAPVPADLEFDEETV
jgi:hypothetical protein